MHSNTVEKRQPFAVETLYAIRSYGSAFKTRQEVFTNILQDLQKKVEFFSTEDRVFLKPCCVPFPIEVSKENRDFVDLLDAYSLTEGEKLFELVTSQIRSHGRREGQKTRFYRHSHYDPERKILYLSNRGQEIIRITTKGIDVVPNGTDGVLFNEPNLLPYLPLRFIDDPETESSFRESLIESVNFTDEKTGISKVNQKRIYEAFLLSLYFPELMPTRPILVLSGEKGSGKSSALRQAGRMMFDPCFDVRLMPDNPAEFDVAVTNESFVVFDNADSHSRWIEDKLAACATGTTISKRRLFTTNEQQVFSVDARIAITARTPKFRREDVTERLIILKVGRFSSFRPEHELNQEFERSRGRILSGIIFTLQGVLQALEETKDFHYEGAMRLADFASFFTRIGIGRGEEIETREALASLLSEQQTFAIEENRLFCFLQDWVAETGGTSRSLSTAELFSELKSYAIEKKQDFTLIARSPVALGQQLATLSRLSENPLSMIQTPLSGRRKAWEITERKKE